MHDLGKHIGRYAALAKAQNAAGWHVAGHGQRGHGRSEGPRGGIGRHRPLTQWPRRFEAAALKAA